MINADGSGEVALTSGAGDLDLLPTFSPDGTRVAFERDNANFTVANIVLVDPNGLNLNPTPLTANAAPVQDFEPAWQPLNPPVCELGGKSTSKSTKKVKVTVTCPTENATVTIAGLGQGAQAAPGGRQKGKKFKLPPVTAPVPAGVPTTVTVKVSKKGQKALKKATKAGKKGKATLTATLTDDLGQSAEENHEGEVQAEEVAAARDYSVGGGGASVPSASAISLSAVCSLPEIRSPPMPRKPPDLSASAACWATAIANVR